MLLATKQSYHSELSVSMPCTIVKNSISEFKEHFGKCEHGYGHWLEVPLIEGEFHFWQILAEFPEAGGPSRRDVARLRLISLIDETMAEFSKVEPVHSDKSFVWVSW